MASKMSKAATAPLRQRISKMTQIKKIPAMRAATRTIQSMTTLKRIVLVEANEVNKQRAMRDLVMNRKLMKKN